MRAKEQMRWTAVSIGLSLMLCYGMGFGARPARADEAAQDTEISVADGGEGINGGQAAATVAETTDTVSKVTTEHVSTGMTAVPVSTETTEPVSTETTAVPVSTETGESTIATTTATVKVTGVDYVIGAGESADGAIDICSVTGNADDIVYIEILRGDKKIASHMPFTVGDQRATEDGAYVGVLSLTLPAFNPEDSYTVKVFEDRAQKTELYTGKIVPVYAQLGEDGSTALIALRTIGAEKRAFQAPSVISRDNASYVLTSKTAVNEAPLTYAYALSDGTAVAAKVIYVDDEGNVLKEQDAGTLDVDSSKEVEIPSVITVDGEEGVSVWRTVSFTKKVTLSFPGQSECTITCKPLTGAEGISGANTGNFYLATINLVDEEGNRLGTDSLNVTTPYLYTAPQRLHVTAKSGVVDTYKISDDNPQLNESKVLVLNPASDNVTDGQKSFDIVYKKLDENDEHIWTVKIINGVADPKADNRVIETKKFNVKPGETETFNPESSITIGDTVYVPVASTKESYSYTYGEAPEEGQQSVYPTLTVYYVPEGYENPEPYEIEVRYVNIANSEVLETHKLTSRPELRDELEITSPETFTKDGVEYVRLDGQEQSLWHSFYSSVRTYTIYYRDINDDLHADTTITRVNVEYEDGPTTQVDGGTRNINDGTTTNDGGTTVNNGGTTTTNNGTTTNNNGTRGSSESTLIDEGTTYSTIPGSGNGGTGAAGGGTNTTTYVDGGTTERVIPGQTRYGGTTVTDNGITDLGGDVTGGGANGGGANGGARITGIPTTSDGELTVINSGDSATMADSAGRDTNTMRIEDDATPLAGPSSANHTSAEDTASRTLPMSAIAGIVAALAAALGVAFFIFFKRRRKNDESEEVAEDADLM